MYFKYIYITYNVVVLQYHTTVAMFLCSLQVQALSLLSAGKFSSFVLTVISWSDVDCCTESSFGLSVVEGKDRRQSTDLNCYFPWQSLTDVLIPFSSWSYTCWEYLLWVLMWSVVWWGFPRRGGWLVDYSLYVKIWIMYRLVWNQCEIKCVITHTAITADLACIFNSAQVVSKLIDQCNGYFNHLSMYARD